MAKIPLIRTGGNFGVVSVLYNTYNETATEGVDYIMPVGELIFEDQQREATIDVIIRDDFVMEYAESFKIQLISTRGMECTMHFHFRNIIWQHSQTCKTKAIN